MTDSYSTGSNAWSLPINGLSGEGSAPTTTSQNKIRNSKVNTRVANAIHELTQEIHRIVGNGAKSPTSLKSFNRSWSVA